jgi:hypothetical protein
VVNKTHYEILEVGTDTPMEDVRAAHGRLSRGIETGNPDGKARLDALDEALATLTDPAKRARYDMAMEARGKPVSEQIEAIEPLLSVRTIVVTAVFVLLGAIAFYFYEEKQDREEAERAAAVQAAAKAKQAAEQAKAADLEARQHEQTRQSEQQSAVNDARRQTEKMRRQEEADKRAQFEQVKQQKDADDAEAREKFLQSGRRVIEDNPYIRYPTPPR